MPVEERILKLACTPECQRYRDNTCPFLCSEKDTCPRVKEIMEEDVQARQEQ